MAVIGWAWLKRATCFARFRADAGGQVAIIFALASAGIVLATGAGIDLGRAYSARQKLSEIATLSCQFSTRPSVSQTAAASYTGTNGFQTYVNAVNAFATSSLTSQSWPWGTPAGVGGAAGGPYFTATAASGSATGPTNASVELSIGVPTSFMQLAHIQQIPVHTRITCQPPAAAPQIVVSGTVLQEGFETPCAYYCFTNPAGGTTLSLIPTNTFPPNPSYTGSYGYKWYVVGYCLETDIQGVINSTVPEGTHAAELDCDNGIGTAGNSSISTKLYLAAGTYELRYNYRSRVDYWNYDPTYICGSTASDVAWANDVNYVHIIPTTQTRTNQINVYLDPNTNGTAPLHTTIDGLQHLAGSNLIDMCVYSPTWIERSVRITINTPAFYWLSFAADGASDSFGGQLDNIRMCQYKCSGSPQDNFPTTWLAANNGGVNKVLFEDKFESPVYVTDPFTTSLHAKAGNLALSYGTTVTAGCTLGYYASPPGWPCQVLSGWATAPYNEVVYWMQGATQGTQYVALQGWNGVTNASDPINRAISRPFLLDPGYYNISYDYTSMEDFAYDFVYGASCYGLATSNYGFSIPQGSPYPQTVYGRKNGFNYGETSTLYNQYLATNLVQSYMSNGQLISTPNINLAVGGAVSYTNPDGSITLSPTVAPDNGNVFTSNTASSPNPIIDACIYSSNHNWIVRSVNVMITKPGLYWLTISAQGDPLTGTGAGPAIDDVKLTALGSLYMSSPPTTALTTIPVPAPQPDTAYTNGGVFNGFSIVADPLTPPGGP